MAMPIWVGIWVAITGVFGVFITFKRVQNTSHGSFILEHLVMTFMGFSLSCGIMSTIVLFSYSYELGIAGTKLMRYSLFYSEPDYVTYDFGHIKFHSNYSEEHGLVGSIFGFVVLQLITAMLSVTICLVHDRPKSSEDEPTTTVMYVTDQSVSMVPGGYVVAQGPGGVPVAIPVQQAGGIVTIPGGHAQMLHIPPQGVLQETEQPSMYHAVSMHGGQMVGMPSGSQVAPVSSSGAERPVAIPVQQAGGIVTIPGGHAQILHIPPQGVLQEAGQPPIYHVVSMHGGQMVGVPSASQVTPVPSSGAERPEAIPVQQPGGIVTIPGGHAQMVHISPQGVLQEACQPPMYHAVSIHGGQMVGMPSGSQVAPVPSSGVEPAHSHLFHMVPGDERNLPPPYTVDEQRSVKA